jgi:hypothetical protein
VNIAGAVFADFVTAPCGNPAQLMTPLGKRTIIAHTLRRLTQVAGLTRRCLYVRPRDQEVASRALRDAECADQIELVPLDTAVGDAPPRAQ